MYWYANKALLGAREQWSRWWWVVVVVVVVPNLEFYDFFILPQKCTSSALRSTDRSIINLATYVITVRACSIIFPAIDRCSVTPLDGARVDETIVLTLWNVIAIYCTETGVRT